jgi:putative transposase
MNTYTQILYHIIFATRDGLPSFYGPNEKKLHGIIWSLLEKHQCHPYAVDGCPDHIHIATHIPVIIALSDLIKNIKLGASAVIKKERLSPLFENWQQGYLGFTHRASDKDKLMNYVHNLKQLHKTETLKDEYRRLLTTHEIPFKEEYLL